MPEAEPSPDAEEPPVPEQVEWRVSPPPAGVAEHAARTAEPEPQSRASSPDSEPELESEPIAAAAPAAPLSDSYTVLPRRAPVRHIPTDSEEPRVLFPRSRPLDRERSPAGTFFLRAVLVCTVLATIATGGWWGWTIYQTRQEFAELWRDVQLFPPNASAASWENLESRLAAAQSRLSSDQWEALQEAWAKQKENLQNRR